MNALTGALVNASSAAYLPGAEGWDLKTLFTNAGTYAKDVGGGFLALMGIIGIIWGGTLLIMKLMSDRNQTSWLKIIALIMIGGALIVGGWTLIFNIGSGGKKTIEDLGGGMIMLEQLGHSISMLF